MPATMGRKHLDNLDRSSHLAVAPEWPLCASSREWYRLNPSTRQAVLFTTQHTRRKPPGRDPEGTSSPEGSLAVNDRSSIRAARHKSIARARWTYLGYARWPSPAAHSIWSTNFYLVALLRLRARRGCGRCRACEERKSSIPLCSPTAQGPSARAIGAHSMSPPFSPPKSPPSVLGRCTRASLRP
jgi:hypothetical protein